jgi:hypothetical protein
MTATTTPKPSANRKGATSKHSANRRATTPKLSTAQNAATATPPPTPGATAPAGGACDAIDRFDEAGVAEVVARLEAIEAEAITCRPLLDNDGVACFDYLYTKITKNVLRCIQAASNPSSIVGDPTTRRDPTFQDPAFMACLDVAFANRYLAAMGVKPARAAVTGATGADECERFQPQCWQTLIEHRETRDISPLIFAVAGVNAHVNFDLAFALVTACTIMGCELESGSNYDDYQAINKIFANQMQQLRWHFENRTDLEKGFDTAWVSRIENWMGDILVIATRDLAWRKAKRLWRVKDDPAEMLRLAQARDRQVAAVNRCLFQLGRLPARAYLKVVPVAGPAGTIAQRGLERTGWGKPNS